ncbi:unnamed protein product, partial [Iphiclides podalirius]
MRAELAAQQLLSEAGRQLFGECGAPEVDLLRVDSSGIILLRVHANQHRRLRAALALCPKTVRMALRTEWATGPGGKDLVVVASREELSAPARTALPEPEPAPGLIRADGSINWGCPCLGGMATGPCGAQFRDAFSCFHYSEAEPKGSECYEKFSVMQECMAQYPELYGKDDDEEEERLEAGAGQEPAAPSAPSSPAPSSPAPSAAEK